MGEQTYIDIHTHLNLDGFAEDWQAALERAQVAGVGCINVGVDVASSRVAIDIANRAEGAWATAGIHPNNAMPINDQDLDVIRACAQEEKVVAIGECGLDYFRSDENTWKKQREVFEAQIAIANELEKPLMLHVRGGETGDAYNDAYEIIKSTAEVPGDVHFFVGTLEEAKRFWDIGYSASFTGVVTFARDYDEVVRNAPKKLIHAETDAPYAAPTPYRGKRNEPAYVVETIKKLAELRGESFEGMAEQLRKNAHDLFRI